MAKSLAMALLILSLVGCSSAEDEPSAEKIEQQLVGALHTDATKTEVEAVLNSLNIEHSFDKYASRYQGVIRNTGGPMDHAIVVYVYMDENGKFRSVEAHDSYTGP